MSPYLKITGRTITMWFEAALVNGFICGITLSLAQSEYLNVIPNIVGLFFITLVFSVPAFFVFWVALLFLIAAHFRERALFRTGLVSAGAISFAVAYISKNLYEYDFKNYSPVVFASIILSAILSVFFHFKQFKKIT